MKINEIPTRIMQSELFRELLALRVISNILDDFESGELDTIKLSVDSRIIELFQVEL